MSSSIFNQQLTLPLSTESILGFLRQSSFWQNVWQASTITNTGHSQLDLQTQLKFALFSTSIQITQSLPRPASPCQANVHWSDHHLTLNYHVSSRTPTSTQLRFSAHLDKSNLLAQSQAKLILRHHWQNFVATLHETQHDFLFQNLQSNSGSLLPQANTIQSDDIQPIDQIQGKVSQQPPTSHQSLVADYELQVATSRLSATKLVSQPLFSQPQLPTIPLPTHGFTLWKMVNDWQKVTKPIFKKEQLTSSQWLVLYFLVELSNDYPSLTASQLTKLTGLHKMVVSDLAKQLVKKHFLRKLKLNHNKKEFQLQVTVAGKTAAFAVFGKLQQAEKDFFTNQTSTTTTMGK